MKRQRFNSIIGKVQLLMFDAISSGQSQRNYERIRKAASRECIRLLEKSVTKSHKDGYALGYEDGFECATIAADSIITAQQRFDEIDRGILPNDLANTSGPGSVSEMQNLICGGLKP